MRENILTVVNHFLTSTWIFILLGLVLIIILENESVLSFIKQKKIKFLYPLFKRGAYLVAGIVLILFSFSIVNALLNIFTPDSFTNVDNTNIQAQGFWATWKHYSNFSGMFAVIGFIIAGEALILSAGNKWLVNLAKLVITITILSLFFSVLVACA
ncbi:MAG: hypothetical protein Q8P62_02675 [Candidatus Peregrinibacteria bacterium]|nr:hypothetical protein [Candidatus Peregrinibacteria bacterium]